MGRFDRVIAARGAWLVCALLLASTLLAGCNRSSASSSAGTAASAGGPKSSATSSAGGSSATSSAGGSSAAQTVSSAPTTTDKTADVSWTAPTANTNGTALTDLAGYTVYYGTSPTALTKTINVTNAGATDYVVQGLTTGTWYFAVTAYTNTGLQSSPSSVVSKTIS